MTAAPLVALTVQRLEGAGYRQIPTPFSVATIRFEFAAALQGRDGRATDLVLVVDTSMSDGAAKIGDRTRQRLEALARALDIVGSHLVLTAILAGASLPPSTVEAIAKGCRVLVITDNPDAAAPADREKALLEFDDRLRVLLPLQLHPDVQAAADPLGEILAQLPNDEVRALAEPLLAASTRGEKAVSSAFAEILESELAKALPQ